jgi:probable rRNA maturation factor
MYNITVDSDPKYPVNRLAIRSVVLEILQRYKIDDEVELGVSVIGDKKMHQINKAYRGIDSSTNILTFALEDPDITSLAHLPRVGFVATPDQTVQLGDVVISYPQVVADAQFEGIAVDEEMRILVEHGVKHLLGIHHND